MRDGGGQVRHAAGGGQQGGVVGQLLPGGLQLTAQPADLRPSLLVLPLDRLGEGEPARVLGEDTLQRCRGVLGPDHLITRYLARVAVTDHPPLEDETAEDDPSPRW